MKQEFLPIAETDCSCLQIEVLVKETWINRFLSHHELEIPISDQYHLIHLRADLADGKIMMLAGIKEKEGSSLKITCLPKWDIERQRILLEELDIKTVSKNILLKSAGWFAKTFMGAKIDKKIEEATNQLYADQIKTILKDGIAFPLPKAGNAMVQVRSVTISEMIFANRAIKVKAMIDGYWRLHLEG